MLTPEDYIKRLMELVGKKRRLLEEMLELTGAQAEALNEDGLSRLDHVIESKQKRIDTINKLDEEFGVYFLRLKQVLGIDSLDQLKSPAIKGIPELKDAIADVMSLMKEISEIEKENSQIAKSLLDALGNEVKKISVGKKVMSAYNPTPLQYQSNYFDKKK